MNNQSILYFGGDELFFSKLSEVVENTLKKNNFTIKQVQISEREIISPIKHTFDSPPTIAILDFSTFTDAAKALAWNFRINNQTKDIILVAVFTLDEAKETHEIIQLNYVDFVHYKSDDLQKILYDASYLATNTLSAQRKYAAYDKISLKTKAFCKSTLTELQKSSVSIQTTVKLSEYISNIEITSPQVLPLDKKSMILTKKSYDYGIVDQSITYQFLLSLGADEKQINPKIYINWLEENKKYSYFSGNKLLIIQKNLNGLPRMLDPNIEQLLHLRYQTKFKQNFKEINDFRPDLIAYDFEQLPSETMFSPTDNSNLQQYNGMYTFERMITTIKNIDDEYEPIIYVFNNNSPSESFKKMLGYDRIKISPNYLDFDLLLKALQISLESKVSRIDQDTLLLSPNDSRAQAKIVIDIQISSISEHEIIFYTPHKLPPRTQIQLTDPLPMQFTIVPSPYRLESKNDMFPHFGLIHCMNEDELNEIRKYVNTLFFQERDQQQKEELEAFQKKNEEEALKHKKKN